MNSGIMSHRLFGFKSVLTVIFAFGFLLGFMATAMATEEKQIRIVNILDLSGPYAPITGPLSPAFDDAWEYINTELNGVHGVKVEVINRDFAGKMPVGLSMYNEAINMSPKPLMISPGSAPLAAALHTRFQEDGIVAIVSTSVDAVYPVANSFGMYGLYPDLIGLGLQHIKDNWQEKRNPRMGIITWDTGYGRAIMTEELYAYAEKIGVDIVGTEVFGIRQVDITTQLMRLRAKKADFLVTNSAASGPIAIKKGAMEMGWRVPLINTIATDWSLLNLAPGMFEGDYAVAGTRSFDETNEPSISKILEIFKKNNRTIRDRAVFYLIGWQIALQEHAAMKETVDKYGWNGLNAENIRKTFQQMKNFNALNGLSIITYSKERPTPTHGRVYKVVNNKLIPQTKSFQLIPDLRPPKYR